MADFGLIAWYYVFIITVSFLIGQAFFAILKIKPSPKKYIHVFEKLVIGLMLYVAGFAAYHTGGVTILIGMVVPFLFMNKAERLVNYREDFITAFKSFLILFLIFLSFYIYFSSWAATDLFLVDQIDSDNAFYSKLAHEIKRHGIESYYLANFDGLGGSPPRTLYHYFDIWLIALVDLPQLQENWQLMMPLLISIFGFGIYAFSRSLGAGFLISLLTIGLLFVAPLGAIDSLQFQVRPLMGLKYLSLVPVFLLFCIKWLDEEVPSFPLLLSLPAMSVLTAPGVIGGIILYRAYDIFIKRDVASKRKSINDLLCLLAVLSVFVFVYAGQQVKSTYGVVGSILDIFSASGSSYGIKFAGQIYSFVLFSITAFLLPYCLFLMPDRYRGFFATGKHIFESARLVVFILVSAMLPAGLLWFHTDGWQFYYIFYTFLCSLISLLIARKIVNSRYKLAYSLLACGWVFILAIMTHYNWRDSFFKIYQKQATAAEIDFRQAVAREIHSYMDSRNPSESIKIFRIRDLMHFGRWAYDYNTAVYSGISFLDFRFDNISMLPLHAHETLKLDAKVIDPSELKYSSSYYAKKIDRSIPHEFKNNLFSYQALSLLAAVSYVHYTMGLPAPYDIQQARVKYIENTDMTFGYADRCSLIPDEIHERVKRFVIQKETGHCFVVF